MTYQDIAAQLLKDDEGVEKFAYQDHLSYWSIGVGRNIDRRNGRGLSPDEIDYLLQNDIKANIAIVRKQIPSFDKLSDNRKAVLISMVHQLGSLSGWPSFRAAIEHQDWVAAEKHALNSKWAKKDTPARAKRLAAMFRKG